MLFLCIYIFAFIITILTMLALLCFRRDMTRRANRSGSNSNSTANIIDAFEMAENFHGLIEAQ